MTNDPPLRRVLPAVARGLLEPQMPPGAMRAAVLAAAPLPRELHAFRDRCAMEKVVDLTAGY